MPSLGPWWARTHDEGEGHVDGGLLGSQEPWNHEDEGTVWDTVRWMMLIKGF